MGFNSGFKGLITHGSLGVKAHDFQSDNTGMTGAWFNNMQIVSP